jgi:hypothetical protein
MKKGHIIAVLLLLLSSGLVFWLGSQDTLSGHFTLVDIAPEDFEYTEPDDLSKDGAEAALAQAKLDIAEMKELGFVTLYANDALEEATKAYDAEIYSEVFKLTQLIAYTKKEKLDFIDRVKLLEIKKQALMDKGVTRVTDVNDMTRDAMNAFTLEQFDEANTMLGHANAMLLDANKDYNRDNFLKLVGRNFFLRYWWQLLILMMIIIVVTPSTVKMSRRKIFETKKQHLNVEMAQTKNAIKNLQKECFVDKSIPVKTYKDRVAKYEDRITEIKQTTPVVEAQLTSINNSSTLLGRIKSRLKRKSKGTSQPSKKKIAQKSSKRKKSGGKVKGFRVGKTMGKAKVQNKVVRSGKKSTGKKK